MFGLPGRHKYSPIALDVGGDGVKMLQMKRAGKGVRVTACGRWRFPAGAPEDPQQRDAMVVEAVRELLHKQGFHGRRVATALGGEELFVKNVRLPHLKGPEMLGAVAAEARERFHFETSPDRVHYLNAGQVRQGTELRDEVILLATPEETITRHLGRLEAMGLRPEFIDAEPVALFRAFDRFLKRTSDEEAVTVLVDLGRSNTRVVVARGREIIFLKTIDVGGEAFNLAVADQLSIPAPEAADMRLRIMQDLQAFMWKADAQENERERGGVEWTIHDALRAQVESLAKEISLCLRYCAVTFRGLRPNRVTLIGGEAYDPAVQRILSEQLGIECVVGQPLRGIDVSDADLHVDRRATLAEWAVCAGLAMHEDHFPPKN